MMSSEARLGYVVSAGDGLRQAHRALLVAADRVSLSDRPAEGTPHEIIKMATLVRHALEHVNDFLVAHGMVPR